MPALGKEEWLIRKAVEHGKHIFAYNNIRTNQIVYSLERSLNSHDAIKQQAYAGANTVPSSLRKDLWRPLYNVSFPSTSQGLAAFRKLREWKKLHEVSWKPEDLPELPLSEADRIERKRRDERLVELGGKRVGGPRTMRDTDYRRRKQNMIQNQKANSIADLAAVLREQEAMGAKLAEERSAEEQKEQRRLLKEVERLAKQDAEGGRAKLDAAIAAMEQQYESKKAADVDQDHGAMKERKQLKFRLSALRTKREKMIAVANVIQEAKAEAMTKAGQTGGELEQVAIDLPAILTAQSSNIGALNAFGGSKSVKQPAKRTGLLRFAPPEAGPTPIFKAEGVRIRWSNPLDAEYAENWPRAVEHDILGFVRNTAPRPSDAPVLEALDRYVYDLDGKMIPAEEARQYLPEQMDEPREALPLPETFANDAVEPRPTV